MSNPKADLKVEIVTDPDQADKRVAVVGDQVVSLVGSSPGDVLTVQPGGDTVAPEDPHPALTVHLVGGAGEPSFQNSWENYGGSYLTARFFKDSDGVVHLEGMVKFGTVGETIFTLPAGFRPSAWHFIDAPSGNQVIVDDDGPVVSFTGNNTYISLSGISFLAV